MIREYSADDWAVSGYQAGASFLPVYFRPDYLDAVSGENREYRVIEISDGSSTCYSGIEFRSYDGKHYDCYSPYGFGGMFGNPTTTMIEAYKKFLEGKGLVAAYLSSYPSESVRNERIIGYVDLSLDDQEYRRKIRKSYLQEIRKQESFLGGEICIETSIDLDDFYECYLSNKGQQGASSVYYLKKEIFIKICDSPSANVISIKHGRNQLYSCFLTSGRKSEYYISAHRYSGYNYSKLAVYLASLRLRHYSDGINLGGGIVPGDSLEFFKLGMASNKHYTFAFKWVLNQDLYSALSETCSSSEYFPAYWGGDDNV